MLNFLKNAGRGKSKFSARPPDVPFDLLSPSGSVGSVDSASTAARVYDFDNIPEDEICEVLTQHKSRLSKDLEQTLSDKQSLIYLVQYMESVSCLPLIEFWIEVESFKQAAELLHSKKTTHSSCLKLLTTSTTHKPVNRTVSFDSSVSVKSIPQSNCLSNGYPENNHPTTPVEQDNSNNIRASCSNITNGDINPKTKNIDLKKALVDDAVRIFKKYIALESPQRLEIPDDMRNTIVSSICHPEGLVDPQIFEAVQNFAFEQMSRVHFDAFIQSAYHCKYQIDILTSGTLTVEDIIYNQMALFYFMEYLEQERSNSLLEFLMAVINYRDQLITQPDYDKEEAQNDAIVLYDKYFSLQATCPLGFSAAIRLDVEENICKEGGPSPDCFHKPFKLGFNLLRQYIKTFLSSQLYYKYLSEMISSVQSGWQTTANHKKSASDCSSEISISARNTLLATGDFPGYNRSNRASMRIDSKLLYNGDLLWRRKTDKGLSLGRVNSLGRFESCMEPEPERKDSVIQRVVNRLVSGGERDKAKEELAWQVAHMIVKDITDVTMGSAEL